MPTTVAMRFGPVTADMVDVLWRVRGMTVDAAYMLTSLPGHPRISQVVAPWMRVRMEISKNVLPRCLPLV